MSNDRLKRGDYKQIAPYGDQHNINDMVYSGGFLLKPRTKLS